MVFYELSGGGAVFATGKSMLMCRGIPPDSMAELSQLRSFSWTKLRRAHGAGSIAWAGALPPNGYDNSVATITKNVIERFAQPQPFVPPVALGIDNTICKL